MFHHVLNMLLLQMQKENAFRFHKFSVMTYIAHTKWYITVTDGKILKLWLNILKWCLLILVYYYAHIIRDHVNCM